MGDEFYFSTFGAGGPGAWVIKGNERDSLPARKLLDGKLPFHQFRFEAASEHAAILPFP
jgi:hypothetical protein